MPPRSKIGGILFLSCLSFCPPLWNFNLANNFWTVWTVSARALIFHMSISCDKTFPWAPLFFTQWPWPWSLTHFLKTLTLLITFEQWVLELWYFTRIFPVIRPSCGLFLTLWHWPWSLTHFLKTLTLLITFKHWVLELWHFTVPLFFTLWPWPWSLAHFLKKHQPLLITYKQWVLELWHITWIFPVIRPFRWYHYFLPCCPWPWPWSLIFFWKLWPC